MAVLPGCSPNHWRLEKETGVEGQHEGKKLLWPVKSHHVRTCVCDRTMGESKMVQVTLSEQGGVVSEPWYL